MEGLMRFYQGSAHDMPFLADNSIQSVICSPPYYGLRKYQGEQNVDWPVVDYAPMPGLPPITVPAMRAPLGNEPTLEAYIGHLILCLREWRRILRDDGTCFVNLGDSFYGGKGANGNSKARRTAFKRGYKQPQGTMLDDTRPQDLPQKGLKPKDLMLVPHRFALAAQADGWFIRSDMIGAKVVPMPESVGDRPTRSHEHIWMLTRRGSYFTDMDAVREPLARIGDSATNGTVGRNMPDVLEWRPHGFFASHFATWPEAIPEKLIRMGSSERGACPHCGAAWRRVVEKGLTAHDGATNSAYEKGTTANRLALLRQAARARGGEYTTNKKTLGFQPSCFCPSHDPVPCVVLDPFCGSGTTIKAAVRLGRAGIGIDISQEYLDDIVPQRMGDGVQMELIGAI